MIELALTIGRRRRSFQDTLGDFQLKRDLHAAHQDFQSARDLHAAYQARCLALEDEARNLATLLRACALSKDDLERRYVRMSRDLFVFE